MRTAAIIVAAGRGRRMGASVQKTRLPIAGSAMLVRAVVAFTAHPRVGSVVVVAEPSEAQDILGRHLAMKVVLVPGGERRQDSVRCGLAAIGDAEVVLVHDAARPLVSEDLIGAVIDAAAGCGAAVPALAITDTVKRLAPDGTIEATVPREGLALAQTPQGFRVDRLEAAYRKAERDGFVGTDDASLVEHAGGRVAVISGSPRNIKITSPPDLELAEAIARVWERGGAADG
jgi:2-C-methyl-D-erythritol 4-phosphate cytidylyltransferase